MINNDLENKAIKSSIYILIIIVKIINLFIVEYISIKIHIIGYK